uniref:F-box domain-containing protein n=1 Tax=Panagrellus redivivus TaxID=6233 RepID=A0A7E4W5Z4_PANRE
MPFFTNYETDILPFSCLPYEFKRRLIQLAALKDATKLSIACPDMKAFSEQRRKCYDDIYITDDQNIHDKAVELRFLHLYCMSYLSDGPLTIDPSWQSVLLVNNIVDVNKAFFVKHTLILDLTSGESYDQAMPFITGSYYRLVLYGEYTWTQVEHLIKDKVKKVRVMGTIDVEPSDHDVVIQFVLRFCRGFDNK